jgi:ClpP class serine protease
VPANRRSRTVWDQVVNEQLQGHETREGLFRALGKAFGRPVVSVFTSFEFPVMLEDADADMLEGVLQKVDLTNGLVLFINSPGGDGVAAERIINMCRAYSGTGEFWAVVPDKAKSAATMVCFGASRILMGPTSELGPIDPQLTTKRGRAFSVFNIIKSYEDLFNRAVRVKSGNLEPFLQQLAKYDAREIQEFRSALDLAGDIAVRALKAGMMSDKSEKRIREQIATFLTPERTKAHGRPIYRDEAKGCGLNIESIEVDDDRWDPIYELYLRSNNYVMTRASKCVESAEHSYYAEIPRVPEDE